MNRGRRSESIFSDRQDYEAFIDLLKETVGMWHVNIAAYCLMPNHYHLLVHTPEANISRAMRHLNGVYTQRYNRRHGFDGALFRGRFKSILISADDYLLQALRYIHRNPLRSGVVNNLNAFPWSSHAGYLSDAPQWAWLHKRPLLSILKKNHSNWRSYYKRWVNVEDADDISKALDKKKWPALMGTTAFIDQVKNQVSTRHLDSDVTAPKSLRPAADVILRAVTTHYGVDTSQLMEKRRGNHNEARSVAIYLYRTLRRDTLKEIGRHFGIDTYSTVSSAVARMKERIAADPKLAQRIQSMEKSIQTGQE